MAYPSMRTPAISKRRAADGFEIIDDEFEAALGQWSGKAGIPVQFHERVPFKHQEFADTFVAVDEALDK